MTELIIALGTLILALLVLNPFHLWMPTMLAMLILGAFFALFCALALFVLRERAGDERDEANRSFAGRAGFLAGAAVLVVAIGYQDLTHQPLDPWLVGALSVMLVGKLLARAWSDRFR